jgi:hypothetical protein
MNEACVKIDRKWSPIINVPSMIPADIVILGVRTMLESTYSKWRVTGRSGRKLYHLMMVIEMELMIMII